METQEVKKRGRPAKTFAEVEVPATEHAKILAKERSERKGAKILRTFYTKNGDKYVKVDVTPKCAYMTYVGKENKGVTKEDVKSWIKNGEWVHELEKDSVCEELISNYKG